MLCFGYISNNRQQYGSVRFESVKTKLFKFFETWTELNHKTIKLNRFKKNHTVKPLNGFVVQFRFATNVKILILKFLNF